MRPYASLAVFLPLAGCVSNLEGEWSGDLNCKGTRATWVAMDVELASTKEYDAAAIFRNVEVGDERVNIVSDMKLVQPKWSGPQALEVQADCEMDMEDGSTVGLKCAQFDELGWDGKDLMEANISAFLGEGVTCKLTLER